MEEFEAELQHVERLARRQQMAAESESLQLHLASRSLVDVCREAMHRGSELTVHWPGGRVTGYARTAINDLVVLRLASGVAAIRLTAVAEITEAASTRDHATSGSSDPGSFVAWCRAAEGLEVQALSVGGIQSAGVLAAVGADHLLMRRASGHTAISLSAVVAVKADRDPLFGF